VRGSSGERVFFHQKNGRIQNGIRAEMFRSRWTSHRLRAAERKEYLTRRTLHFKTLRMRRRTRSLEASRPGSISTHRRKIGEIRMRWERIGEERCRGIRLSPRPILAIRSRKTVRKRFPPNGLRRRSWKSSACRFHSRFPEISAKIDAVRCKKIKT